MEIVLLIGLLAFNVSAYQTAKSNESVFSQQNVNSALARRVGQDQPAQQPTKASERKEFATAASTKITEQPDDAEENDNPTANYFFVDQGQTTRQTDTAKQADENIKMQRKLVRFTGLLVIVGFLTAVVIGWQSWETRKAAEATEKNVSALVESERAWILVETGDIPDDFEPNPTYLSFLEIRPVLGNHGKTPGRITRVAIKSHQIPVNDALPPEPEFEPSQISEADILLPAGDVRIQPMPVKIASTDFIKIRMGDPTLYVYGFVEYTDLGRITRKSNFCFVYHIPHGFTSLSRGFYTPGNVPKAYTRCT